MVDRIGDIVFRHLSVSMPKPSQATLADKTGLIVEDVRLLARCAASGCRITYTSAIALRGHGNVQSGKWLDDVFDYALYPLQWPDLTLLVVNKATGIPSDGAYHAGRLKKSKIRPEEVRDEQRRAVAFRGYAEVLGNLEAIPREFRHSSVAASAEIEREQGLDRAVANAVGRVGMFGKEKIAIGREYPDSLSSGELKRLARDLMAAQDGRCALTGTPFDEASEVDRVSLDRIDCDRGYSKGNVQLTTVFADRARGTLDIPEARQRLVQWSPQE